MKKFFNSPKTEDIAWLGWGAARVRQMLAAGVGKVKRLYPREDLQVTMDGRGSGEVRVEKLPIKHYYGYGSSVMSVRCACRNIVLAETSAAAHVSVTTPYNGTAWSYTPVTLAAGTLTGYSVANNLYDGSPASGTLTLTYILNIYKVGGSEQRSYTSTQPYSSDVTVFNAFRNEINAAVAAEVSASNSAGIAARDSQNAALLAAAQAAANEENARRDAAAQQRSAAFLTDGTEQASWPIVPTSVDDGGNVYTDRFGVFGIHGGFYAQWAGDSWAQTYTFNDSGPKFEFGVRRTITVPDDACYKKTAAPAYPGASAPYPSRSSFNITLSVVGVSPSVWDPAIGYGSWQYVGSDSNVYGSGGGGNSTYYNGAVYEATPGTSGGYTSVVSPDPLLAVATAAAAAQADSNYDNAVVAWTAANATHAALAAQWTADWGAAQAVALTREHARRKKCSDGQIMYLRNGFLSPEMEFFVKSQHPKSAKVRRTYAMTYSDYTSPTTTVVNPSYSAATIGHQLYSTATTNVSITLKYDVGTPTVPNVKSQTLSGKRVVYRYRTNYNQRSDLYTEWTKTEFTGFPVVTSATAGTATVPVVGESSRNLIVHDNGASFLVAIANGTAVTNTDWVASDPTASIPVFYPVRAYDGAIEQSSYDVSYTHPPFLMSYISDSKPIEVESGASTDWLSSRIADGEVVTVIPLGFVNATGEDRGMFPYSRTDEPPASVAVYGYGKFKYSYAIGTFTFVSWTDFTTVGKITHTGTAQYNDEVAPTKVTVSEVSYDLQPRTFAFNAAWTTQNCVCIGDTSVWTDTWSAYKAQKAAVSSQSAGQALTAEQMLYKAVQSVLT